MRRLMLCCLVVASGWLGSATVGAGAAYGWSLSAVAPGSDSSSATTPASTSALPGPPESSPDLLTATELSATDTALAAASDTAGTAPPASPSGAPDPEAASQFSELSGVAETRDNAEQEAEATAAAALDPVETASEYSRLPGAAALSLATSTFPGLLSSALQDGVPMAPGDTLDRILGGGAALVSDASGRGALLLSNSSLMGTTADGTQAPVDLNLIQNNGRYVPQSSAVTETIPTTASGETQFTNAGFGFQFENAENVAGQLTHGRAFYPDLNGASQETDGVLEATNRGVEAAWILRGSGASENQSLQFDLPAGAYLQLDGPAGASDDSVSIMSADGSLLGAVLPPSAIDAAGQTVPSSYSVSGTNTLVMHIADTSGSFAYPILADPTVTPPYQQSYSGSMIGGNNSTSTAATPTSWAPGYDNGWSPYFTWGQTGGYAYTYAPSKCAYSSCSGGWGEWYLPSFSGAYIYEEFLTGVYHSPDDSEAGGGIFGPGQGYFPSGSYKDTNITGSAAVAPGTAFSFDTGSEAGTSSTTTDYCLGGTTTGAAGSCPLPSHAAGIKPNNDAVAATIEMRGTTASNAPEAAVTGATVYESDDQPVTLASSPTHSGYSPGTWTNSFTDSVGLSASVPSGLGLGSYAVSQSSTPFSPGAGQTTLPIATPTCSAFPCLSQTPTVTVNSAALPEGSYDLYAQARSVSGELSTVSTPWLVQIDRTPPPPPAVTGIANDGATGTIPTLTISPTDPPAPGANASSGPASAAVSLDGGAPSAPIACATSCTWTPPSNLSEGAHTISITATDIAGNTGQPQVIKFYYDLTAPTLTLGGTAVTQPEAITSDSSLTLTASAADSNSGVAQISTQIDGNTTVQGAFATQSCPNGGCSLGASGTINTAQLSTGMHSVIVTATDAAGNVESAQFPLNVERPNAAAVQANQSESDCTASAPANGPTPASTLIDTTSQAISKILSIVPAVGNSPQADLEQFGTAQPEISSATPANYNPGSDQMVSVSGALENAQLDLTDGAVELGSGSHTFCVAPASSTPAATPGSMINSNVAALFANTGSGVDSVIRPTVAGVQMIEQLRDTSSPGSYSWNVQLQAGQQLQTLANGDVAVVDPAPPADVETANPPASTTPSNACVTPATTTASEEANTQAQICATNAAVAAAVTATSGQAVLLFTAPWAQDGNGNPVTTSLSASGNTITLDVTTANAALPIEASMQMQDVQTAETELTGDTFTATEGGEDNWATTDTNNTAATDTPDDYVTEMDNNTGQMVQDRSATPNETDDTQDATSDSTDMSSGGPGCDATSNNRSGLHVLGQKDHRNDGRDDGYKTKEGFSYDLAEFYEQQNANDITGPGNPGEVKAYTMCTNGAANGILPWQLVLYETAVSMNYTSSTDVGTMVASAYGQRSAMSTGSITASLGYMGFGLSFTEPTYSGAKLNGSVGPDYYKNKALLDYSSNEVNGAATETTMPGNAQGGNGAAGTYIFPEGYSNSNVHPQDEYFVVLAT